MDSTPASLLECLRCPEEDGAWERFVDLYTPMLFHWARRAGLGQDDAADLVQDIFVILLNKLPGFTYDPEKSFRSWLRTVTLNRWRNFMRRKNQAPTLACPELLEGAVAEADSMFEDGEYRKGLLQQAMEQIRHEFAPTTWAAFERHGLAARSAGEVAHELGITPGAVYAAKFRVVSRLRAYLNGLFE